MKDLDAASHDRRSGMVQKLLRPQQRHPRHCRRHHSRSCPPKSRKILRRHSRRSAHRSQAKLGSPSAPALIAARFRTMFRRPAPIASGTFPKTARPTKPCSISPPTFSAKEKLRASTSAWSTRIKSPPAPAPKTTTTKLPASFTFDLTAKPGGDLTSSKKNRRRRIAEISEERPHRIRTRSSLKRKSSASTPASWNASAASAAKATSSPAARPSPAIPIATKRI